MKKKRALNILNDFEKMKRIAKSFYDHKDWEKALKTIFFASGFMYTMNQCQYDTELEEMIKKIADENLPALKPKPVKNKMVVYYDGFGHLSRGLSGIYIKALTQLGYQIKYITFAENRRYHNRFAQLIGDNNIHYIEGNFYVKQILQLADFLANSEAEIAFLYIHPDDVVAVGAFSHCPPGMKRYLINLTDHAFWLGKSVCDKVINFREFGYLTCIRKRDIPASKLVYLPYYPAVETADFQGLPFSHCDHRLILSGGALYKTQSKDKKYYRLIEAILDTWSNVDFVYFGCGDTREIRHLIQKYPDRAFFSTERSDFFEIMKRCTFYLSTYPYNGGLMTQFSLLAGKVPVTLIHPEVDAELTVHHEQSFWNYPTIDGCLQEIGRLLGNDSYRRQQETRLQPFLITANQFVQELQYILLHGRSMRSVADREIAFDGFQMLPLENMIGFRYYRLFFRKYGAYMIRFFPIKYCLGMLAAIFEKRYKQ